MSPSLLKRVVAGAGKGAVTEGATEGAQAVLERAGAARALTGEEAYSDYVENIAAGALGGGVAGGPAGIRRPTVTTSQPVAATEQLDPGVVPAPASVEAEAPAAPISTRPVATSTLPFPDAAPGSLSDAANVAASATGRPQARTDDSGFRRTLAEKASPAPAPQVDTATGEILAPLGEDGRPARTSRWLDDQGAPRDPSDAELGAFMHETLDAMGSPPSVKRGQIFELARAEDGALKGPQLSRVFKQVWDERKAALEQPAGMEAADNQAHAWQNEQFDKASDDDIVSMARGFFGKNLEQVTVEQAARMINRPPEVIERLWDRIKAPTDKLSKEPAAGQASAGKTKTSPTSNTEATQEPAVAPIVPAALAAAAPQSEAALPQPRGAEASSATPPVQASAAAAIDQTPPSSPAEAAPAAPVQAEGLERQAQETSAPASPSTSALQVESAGSPSAQDAPAGSVVQAAVGPDAKSPAPGKVRVYTGSAVDPGEFAGDQHFSVSRDYAQGYADKNPGAKVYAVDVDEALLERDLENGIPGRSTLTLPEDVSRAAAEDARPASPAVGVVQAAAATAATSPDNDIPTPTPAQVDAGNFKVGRAKINGLDISIEHPAGVKRKASHTKKLRQAYGYIRRTESADGEKFDVFLGDRADDTSLPVFVVDQKKADGSFDESKGMLGFTDEASARAAYLSNYPKGWEQTGLGGIKQMSHDEFKAWVRDAEATRKPAAEPEPTPKEAAQRAIDDLVSRIADGQHPERVLEGVDDKTAREVANAIGFRFAKTAKAANIAANLGAKSQPDVRTRAARAREVANLGKQEPAAPASASSVQEKPAPAHKNPDSVQRKPKNSGSVQKKAVPVQEKGGRAPATVPALTAKKEDPDKELYDAGRVALFSRRGWDETFPDAILGHLEAVAGAHLDYAAAKSGNDEAALRLARDLVTPEYLKALRTALPKGRRTMILPVRALEATGKNRIPAMAARVIANRLGLPVAKNIVQASQVSRTNAGGIHRLANAPEFTGAVSRDGQYLLLDDTLTLGGTLAALKTYIEDNGGKVVLASALTGQRRSAKLTPSPATIQTLRERYGSIESWWRDTFGYGFEGLTESEARFIVELKDRPSPEQLRDRVDAARVPPVGEVGGENDSNGPDRPALSKTTETPPKGGVSGSGLSMDEGQRLKTALTAKWGENAPQIRLVEGAAELASAARGAGMNLSAADVDRVEGMYLGKPTVWLNIGEIRTEERFAQVLAHEAIGHYGVERVVGKDEWTSIRDAIDRHVQNRTGAQDVKDAIAQLRRTQPDIFSDPETVAKEVIAVMAERGSRNGLVKRFIAAVQRFLRRLMPSRTWSDVEIRDLINQSDRFLHAGRTNEQRRATARTYAFSRGQRETPAYGSEEWSDLVDEVLQADGRPIADSVTADKLWSNGQRIFALHENADSVSEVTSHDMLQAYTPDQLLALPRALAEQAGISEPPANALFSASGEVDVDTAFVAGLTPKERNAPSMVAFAQAMYADLGTDSPFFQEWFGDSKVVDKDGAPVLAYHGTGEEFAAFDPKKLGKSTNHMTAALGIFFDQRLAKATHYAELASKNVPAEQVVLEGYLAIQKPYAMSKADFMAIDSIDKAKETRARLEREGYDGIQLPEIGQWIAFKPEQFKRTDNRGTFDRADARMLFSKAPAEAVDSIEQQIRQVDAEVEGDQSILGRARAALKASVPKKLKDATRTSWLGALTLRHLVELGGDYFPTMRIYGDYMKEMEADRNQLQQEGEDVAETARKWAGKNLPEAGRTFDLMHDATIAGVDPAEGYQPLQFRQGGKLVEVNKANVKHHLQILREQMRGRAGDSKKNIMDEAKSLKAMLAAEPRRKASYPALVARWNALSTDAKATYVAMRDLYAKRSQQTEEGLVQRIKDLKMEGGENHKRALITTIRHQFETQRLQGVYFPLQRFGQYFVAADKDGTPTYQMFESLNALETAVKSLRAKGFTITAQGLKSEGKAKDAPSGTFVAEVLQMLNKAGVSDQTQDQIYQMYLQALPELSMRKHSIHRKSVIGFDPDAIRGFAFNMQHGAHQLARLRFAHKLQDTITVLQDQQNAKRKEPDADTRRIAAGDAVLGELDKRHEWISNPTDSGLTNLVSSFGFTYFLGLTPAAALVNLSQTALISYPYLASRFGAVKAMNQLLRGMSGSARRLGHIDKDLAGDELRAHQVLQKMGALDKTQTHNLAGIAEGGLTGYNPKWAKAMEIIGWGFHKTEVINREATGIAAFRLATAEGKSFDEAVKVAADTIHDTHYDYSNANRARFMQSGTAKVLLMFRQYSLNTTWHLGRMVWNATKGADPEVKAIARRNLAGILGMTSLFAGTLGLPLASVTMGVLNAVAASAGDDDEPWDAETEFRKFLVGMFGEGTASVILGGVANPITGADIASRVSMSQLWFRDADRELDGRGAYYNLLEQAAGPMGGVLKNALVGKQLMDEGHLMRGVETVLPKSLKDMVKAARYSAQGVSSLRGDAIVEDLSVKQLLLQLGGFTPAEVAERYDSNRALKNYERHILDRRQRLVDAVALSVRTGDAEGRRDAMASIGAFNRKYPEIAITQKSLKKSLAARARYSRQAEGGVILNKKIAARVREEVGVQ